MYIVRTLKLKKYLEEKGFKVEGIAPNKEIPNFIVWLFEDNEAIRRTVKEYSNK